MYVDMVDGKMCVLLKVGDTVVVEGDKQMKSKWGTRVSTRL